MVNVSMEYKQSGQTVSEKYFTTGELKMSELGFTSVRYQKTINRGNYESLVLGVEVQVPHDAARRFEAEGELEDAFKTASDEAVRFLAQLEKRLG